MPSCGATTWCRGAALQKEPQTSTLACGLSALDRLRFAKHSNRVVAGVSQYAGVHLASGSEA
eukprot:3122034-Alexandrium_andersonii.AAC.1